MSFGLRADGLVGGYSPIPHPNQNPEVVNAAQYAAQQIFPGEVTEVKVCHAEQQVVAGLNYK